MNKMSQAVAEISNTIMKFHPNEATRETNIRKPTIACVP